MSHNRQNGCANRGGALAAIMLTILILGTLAVAALVALLLLDRGTGPPKFAPSIWNCTLPVGVPDPGRLAATCAVKVTGWPEAEGSAAEPTLVVMLSVETVCWNVPVLVVKLASPL